MGSGDPAGAASPIVAGAACNFTEHVIEKWALERPGDRAMLWIGPDGSTRSLTFAELAAGSRRAGAALAAAGVRRGDVVLLLMSREIEWWELMLGCIALGAVASPGTVQLSAKDIAYRAVASRARCIVATDDTAPKVDAADVAGDIARLTVGNERGSWISYRELRDTVVPLATFANTYADEPALCYFTSGTTGQPKMTLHGHAYAMAHEITGSYWLGLTPDDLHWNLSDTGWAKAAWSSLFAPWMMGAAILVHHSRGFDTEASMDILEAHPVTSLCAPPTAYRMFVRGGLTGRRFAHLRHCVSAGEPLNPEVIDLWRSATNLDIHDGYGQTETVLLCANRAGASRQGSMGRPAPQFDLRVIDEDGTPLPAGREGDIALRAGAAAPPGLFLCYQGDADRTASVYRGEWYLTGDRATVDEDGYFWFVGRSDDVILSSGYRIGPFEVESALFEHPAVAESAVVASPDPTRGEIVKAFVVLAPGYVGSEELVRALQNHVKAVTAPYKYPRSIVFVDGLPKTVSGKIRRKELRDIEWYSR